MSISLNSGFWSPNHRSQYRPPSLIFSEKLFLSPSSDKSFAATPHQKPSKSGLRKLPAFKTTLKECNESSDEENPRLRGNKPLDELSLFTERKEIQTRW